MKQFLIPYYLVVVISLQSMHCSATSKIIYKLSSKQPQIPPPETVCVHCGKTTPLYKQSIKSSYPYITGYTFRSVCDFILDCETNTLDPEKMAPGDLVFIGHNFIEQFFNQYRPKIQHPFILVTHHCFATGDEPTPGRHAHYLEDEKLLAWFTVNADSMHPKVKPLPLGIANSFSPSGDTTVYDYHIKTFRRIAKTKLLYSNFDTGTYPLEREYVHHCFKDKNFCTVATRKPQSEYLIDVAHHKFVLSPRGNGLDCYRTWEALLMDSIPIVRSSTLDPLFENLPVLIIEDWQEITEEFLEQKYQEIQSKMPTYNFEKLYIPYWINEIQKCKLNVRLSFNEDGAQRYKKQT